MASPRRYSFNSENIPSDLVAPILEHLLDRRDLGQCALVSWTFNRVATPLLYRTLDSRIRRVNGVERSIAHPSKTLLQKAAYPKYVRHIREMGMVGAFEPSLMPDCREALRRCTNLRSFTWMDDGCDTSNDDDLLAYLSILQSLPLLSSLTIRTSSGISEEVWSKLTELTKLSKVSIWCMHGKPRVLQGWSEKLGESLTHLELGVSGLSRQHPYCVPATILLSVLSQLPNLRSLRLKGAPSTSIPEILTVLPNLKNLDTEYFGSNLLNLSRYLDTLSSPIAQLKELTVRTSSVDVQGPKDLWSWIRRLIPEPSLERLTLNTFSTQGDMEMPRMFLLDLAKVHKMYLRSFVVDTVQMTLEDLECLCSMFPYLEELSCSIAFCPGSEFIGEAISKAHNLRRMKLHVNWVRDTCNIRPVTYFSSKEAREWMLRENSRLRDIAIGQVLYTGRWVRRQKGNGTTELEFEVIRDVVHDSWI